MGALRLEFNGTVKQLVPLEPKSDCSILSLGPVPFVLVARFRRGRPSPAKAEPKENLGEFVN